MIKRVTKSLIRVYREWKILSLENKIALPDVLIIVGSQYSGANELIEFLSAHISSQVMDETFLRGLHGWFPSMNYQIDKILRDKCDQTGVYQVRLLMKEMLEAGKLNILRINTSHDPAQYPSIIDTIKLIFPNALYIQVIRNPITEFCEFKNREPEKANALEFSYQWRHATREWLNFARTLSSRFFIISRNANLSTSTKERITVPLILKIVYRPEHTVLRWQSFREIWDSDNSFGLIKSIAKSFGFSDLEEMITLRISEDDKKTISRLCVWEMRLLRHISVGASLNLTDEQLPADERNYDAG